jgi:hypothetical protein
MRTSIEALENRLLLALVTAGNDGFDYGTSTARLSDGSMIVAGVFSGTVTFGPGRTLTSAGDSDIFAARYDPAGTLVWVRQFGGERGEFDIEDDLDDAVDVAINPERAGGEIFTNGVGADPRDAGEYVTSVAIGPGNSVYLTGGFLGQADFDPGSRQKLLTSVDKDYYDVFVVKLTSSGNLIWANKFGGRFTDMGNDIAVDGAGNAYVTGLFTRDADFDPSGGVLTLSALGRGDAYAMKLNSRDGRLLWASQLGSEELDRDFIDSGNGIAFDSRGNVYFTGTFTGDTFFKAASDVEERFIVTADDGTDGFVAKLDTAGDLVWMRPFGGEEFDGGVAIALAGSASSPDVIVGGYFEETVTVATGTFTATPEEPGDDPFASDLMITRWSNAGSLQWAKQMGGGFFETIGRIAVDASNNIYITGSFSGTADFNPAGSVFNLTSIAFADEISDANNRKGERFDSYDNFFASLNFGGVFRFAVRFGGSDDDHVLALSRPQLGETVSQFVLTGRFAATADFDPSGTLNRTARGRSDIWAAVYDTSGALVP